MVWDEIYEMTESTHTPEERSLYKIVRKDFMTDVAGLILKANVRTGECKLRGASGDQDYNFPQNGFFIVRKKR